MIGRVDDERVEMIEAAVAAVGDDVSIERARLLALSCQELFFGPDRARGRRRGVEAQEMARALGDDRTLAEVIIRRGLPAMNGTAWPEYVELMHEAADLADHIGDPALRTVARVFYSGALFAIAEFDRARAVDAEMRTIAAEGSPSLAWTAASHGMKWIANSEPIEVAHAANDACREMGASAGEPDHLNWWAGTSACVSMMRDGDVGALADVAALYAAQYPGTHTWRLVHAQALVEDGRVDEADAVLAPYAADPTALADEPFPFVGCIALARIAFHLRRPEAARAAEELLRPHTGRWSHFFLGSWGPVDYDLGACASVLGDHDRAVELASRGMAAVDAAGMVTLRDHLSVGFARIVMARGADGDDARARAILEGVVASTAVTDAAGVRAKALALLGSC
jgi:hypothetical protein